MAHFHSLKQKEKRYVFDFLGNRADKEPAAVVFSRFPLPDELFTPGIKNSVFDGVDFAKLGKKDGGELEKFVKAFMDDFTGKLAKVDYGCFARECFEHFENFTCDGKEIKTVEDFLALNAEMTALIADDCYRYAKQRDEFSLGEY